MRSLLVCALLASGCGVHATSGGDGGDPSDPSRCGPGVQSVPDEGRMHLPEGTPIAYKSNPPASGSHWPYPHAWGVFLDAPVAREQWVHNLEHGGIVFTFNCGGGLDGGGGATSDGGVAPDGGAYTAGCPDVVRALVQLQSELKPDKWNEVRVLVTPDPLSPKRVAAIAWDWVWLGDDVDLPTMRCFRDARYGRGPEDAP